MKVLVIGHTGLIGSQVMRKLKERGHEPIGVNHKTTIGIDIEDEDSISRFFAESREIDHVVVTTGNATFGNFNDLDSEAFKVGLQSKLLGQILVAKQALSQKGIKSVTLTSGALSHSPIPGSSGVAFVNGGIDSFVKAVNLDLPEGKRLNVVSPGWIKETMEKMGMDSSTGVSAENVALLYLKAIEEPISGMVIQAEDFIKLEHVNLVVSDIEETKKFLMTAFPEWRVRGEGVGTWSEKDRRWIHLGNENYYVTLNDNGVGPNRDLQGHDPGLAHIGFVVKDSAAIYERLLAAGYSVYHFGDESQWRKTVYFVDPQGFEFEFLQYLSDRPEQKNQYN